MNPVAPNQAEGNPPEGVVHTDTQQSQVLNSLSQAVTQATGETHQVTPITHAPSLSAVAADTSPSQSLPKKDLFDKIKDLWHKIVGKKMGFVHSQQGLDIIQQKLEKTHIDSTITRV